MVGFIIMNNQDNEREVQQPNNWIGVAHLAGGWTGGGGGVHLPEPDSLPAGDEWLALIQPLDAFGGNHAE